MQKMKTIVRAVFKITRRRAIPRKVATLKQDASCQLLFLILHMLQFENDRKTTIYETLSYLFEKNKKNSTKKPCPKLLEHLANDLDWHHHQDD